MAGPPKARFELARNLTPETFEASCRESGMKILRTRRAVIAAIAASEGPFDFDALFDIARRHEPAIGRDTIYRSLRAFLSAGLIRKQGG